MNTPPTVTRTEILRVRIHDGQGGCSERTYDASVWYIISDKAPHLDIELVGPPLKAIESSKIPGCLKAVQGAEWKNGVPYWQQWDLSSEISKARRTGRFELSLRGSKTQSLRCYVIPSKLLGVADVWSMIEAVERELGRAVAWVPEPSLGTRAYFRVESRGEASMTSLLLDAVAEELIAARSLRRDALTELSPYGASQPVPECGLVTIWAIRRSAELEYAGERIEQDLAVYAYRISEHMTEARKIPTEKLRQDATEQLARLRELGQWVRAIISREELGFPVVFGSATQRDYRLRRLLRAFAPPTSEVISEEESKWSRLPPVTMNHLFECWGAVWIVRKLQGLGFSGGTDLKLGMDGIEGVSWSLRRGDVRVSVDYEMHPARLNFDGVPAVDQRTESAIEWAIKRQFRVPHRAVFGSRDECSPDYILRFEGPNGRVMAIGDACLADPEFHTKSDNCKVTTVAKYRRALHWWAAGHANGCHPLGGFVLFPGPTERWSNYRVATSEQDVWVFCPEPRDTSSPAAQLFEQFLGRLIGEVDRA